MPNMPTVEEVRTYIISALNDTPTGSSSRFALAEGARTRFSLSDDDARSLIGRGLASLQDERRVEVLMAESWDMSGDERVRLAS